MTSNTTFLFSHIFCFEPIHAAIERKGRKVCLCCYWEPDGRQVSIAARTRVVEALRPELARFFVRHFD
jgi:hypothetical protein